MHQYNDYIQARDWANDMSVVWGVETLLSLENIQGPSKGVEGNVNPLPPSWRFFPFPFWCPPRRDI